MANLTQDKYDSRKPGEELAYDVAKAARIFGGGIVCANATGYAVPGTDAANHRFLGVAQHQVDNRDGDDGDGKIRCHRKGIHYFACSGLSKAAIGKEAYVVDDQSVALADTTTNDVKCGVIAEFINPTRVGVDIEKA